MSAQATIVGTVEYRLGDGPMQEIPKGPVEYDVAITDVTLTWSDGDTREATAIPRADFSRYVSENAIQLEAGAEAS